MKEIDYERMNDLDRALEIALDAHSGDTDKANEAYIRHPLRVMQAMDTKTERIVALLHDVVEDSEYTLDEIEQEFNKEICDAVDCLTKDENKRKEMDDTEYYLEEFIEDAAENEIARKVKRADIEDNMDLTRLSDVAEENWEQLQEEDWKRLQKYHKALKKL